MNRYTVAREVTEGTISLVRENKLVENGKGKLNIKFQSEKHLADRMIDRKLDVATFLHIIQKMVKFNMCEVLYAAEVSLLNKEGRTSDRISIKYRDYVICMTVTKYNKFEYTLKFRTVLWHPSSDRGLGYIIELN